VKEAIVELLDGYGGGDLTLDDAASIPVEGEKAIFWATADPAPVPVFVCV